MANSRSFGWLHHFWFFQKILNRNKKFFAAIASIAKAKVAWIVVTWTLWSTTIQEQCMMCMMCMSAKSVFSSSIWINQIIYIYIIYIYILYTMNYIIGLRYPRGRWVDMSSGSFLNSFSDVEFRLCSELHPSTHEDSCICLLSVEYALCVTSKSTVWTVWTQLTDLDCT